ncbi:hypothetical protein QWZ13_17545 [Reinekea marina]|uniref:DUF1127 domain-containing protein n=1 Tax=Reinekea marina TaxID=1310421 RepID=A0ABV7WL78_9GAMM|nr:hypothetical protein [Reinekea marina]MDN3650714.1 hypothetical protein [Reinekea marina]
MKTQTNTKLVTQFRKILIQWRTRKILRQLDTLRLKDIGVSSWDLTHKGKLKNKGTV